MININKEYLALTDQTRTKTLVIVLWESAEDSVALRSSSEFQEIFAAMGQYFTASPTREAYDVSAHF